MYIWQLNDWPAWRYNLSSLTAALSRVSHTQGHLLGRLADAGLHPRDEASLAALTEDVIKTSEIEGEILDADSVRSSIARRLGMEIGALGQADRHVDGVVEMVLDATANPSEPLTIERLQAWHGALFPTGRSGLSAIRVAAWRNDASEAMQVVSGPINRRKLHYQAPPADVLDREMSRFVEWANDDTTDPPLLKAGLAHLWFVTLHPFDDGNGRIARAVGDLFLARADGSSQRFYSLSAQIQRTRKTYYEILESTQKGSMDVTEWLAWLLGSLDRSIQRANESLDGVLLRTRFWRQWGDTPMNERQVKLLNRLLDGFEGKLTNRKWAAIAKCSPDTALRDLSDLVSRGVLQKAPGGGRSTAYELVPLTD